MTKNIIFISIDGMTDQLGQSQVIPYLKGLSEKGFNVTIVSCEKKKNFNRNEKNVTNILQACKIKWEYCYYQNRIPLLSQRENFINLKNLAEKKIIEQDKNTIMHCRSLLAALIGLKLKKKYGVKFIFDMRGFWADERIDGNIWSKKNPLHKILYTYFKYKEIEIIEHADFVVVLTNRAKKEIHSWQLKTVPKMEVIPCCADVNHFTIKSNEEKSLIRRKLNIREDVFVVGYLGSLGTWYMQNEMLDFFIELQKKKHNSLFFFITNDLEEDILKAAELKNILPSSILVRSAKREEVPSYISSLDIGLFFIKPLYSKKGSSPTKLAELLACGIPVITNKGIGDVDQLLLETKGGILVSSFNKEGYITAIDKIDALSFSKQTYREIALTNFSLQKGINTYEKVYTYLSSAK